MKKLLVFGVIVLFLGLAIAPSINANIGKASDDIKFVEITVKVCGTDGLKPHTVSLSEKDAEEVEKLFDEIQRKLDEADTREETIKIFNEAIVELDKYDLLNGLSIKQAQRLVTKSFSKSLGKKFIDRISPNKGENNSINALCLIAGNTTNTISRRFGFIFFSYYVDASYILLDAVYALWFLRSIIPNIIPIYLTGFILFGYGLEIYSGWWKYHPAKGSIWTYGLLGKRTWDNSLYGQLPKVCCDSFYFDDYYDYYYYPGVFGFTGLTIRTPMDSNNTYFLGSAIFVNIGMERP